jgi:benzoyl-CoA reductase/2-hydroxyglutaryl-CoA dehydratase subunit BcrC/BadD/HgdB
LEAVQEAPSVVGITATVPVEILLAGGRSPLDLNNLFITASNPQRLIAQAEAAGFAHNICAWIKGIYSTVLERRIQTVVAVTGGDCSNTVALSEVLASRGVRVVHFEYPLSKDRTALRLQMEKLAEAMGATWDLVLETREGLKGIRRKLNELDRLTYVEGVVTGLENHLFLVGSSDFKGDPQAFEAELDTLLASAKRRTPVPGDIRLGYLGVPPIYSGFYDYIASLGAKVVFNEVQRQFSMPAETSDIVDQYLVYTYPYDAAGRIEDIRRAVSERRIDGLIHYTQTFCYRQIYDILIREVIDCPVLTLEGDRPGPLDGRTAFRIETFVEMLRDRKHS